MFGRGSSRRRPRTESGTQNQDSETESGARRKNRRLSHELQQATLDESDASQSQVLPRNVRVSASLPLSSRTLQTIVDECDADQLVFALSTRPGWKLMLESEEQDGSECDLRIVFDTLKKCCKASTQDSLRRFLSDTLGIDKFVTKCCLLFPGIGLDDLRLVEDVVSVLQASAALQPAGLAKPCMVLLCALESNRTMISWNDTSELDLVAKMKAVREQITAAVNSKNAERFAASGSRLYKGYRTSGTSPNSFRDLSIFPTENDFQEEHPFLRPNIVRGAYESLDDYLDVHFRLLREDYVTPLRDGLREFKGLGKDFCRGKLRTIQNVRFYTGVQYHKVKETSSTLTTNERITLGLAPGDFKRVNWTRSKRLTNGSLVGVSKDDFKTIIFATVSHRDPNALQRNGMLTLELCFGEQLSHFSTGIEFSLIESSGAYFEAYRHNLSVIQTITELPFTRNLVFADGEVKPPSFLSRIEQFNLGPILEKPSCDKGKFSSTAWPQLEDTILNDRQFEAMKSAFRNELCVIQGPPGTGKTFVGLKIVELMLLNKVTTKPLLIVCYTNHALDQFLEGISEFTTNIVRLGGRCNSEKLEQFTLRNLRSKIHPKQPRFRRRHIEDSELNDARRLTARLRHERNGLLWIVERIEQDLARLQGKDVFQRVDRDVYENLNLDRIDRIVIPDEQHVNEDDLDDDGHLSDEDKGEVEDGEIVMLTYGSTRREAAIKKMLGSHKRNRYCGQFNSLAYTRYKLERRRRYVDSRTALRSLGMLPPDAPVRIPAHLELELEEWWQLYREMHWEKASRLAYEYIDVCTDSHMSSDVFVSSEELEKLREPTMDHIELAIRCLNARLIEVREALLQKMKESSEGEAMLDFEAIKYRRIIGVTTTGAAKFNTLLRKLEYEVVVVEEAAEILEAHLITTLCPSTKQLILIGDHQQLQPSATVYKLATSFNLQVSLFERLINNGIPYVRLQEQHRMRDQFLKLLVPTIYSDYFSHKSVFEYENIKGLSNNLFFITHENSEESERENSSKSNLFEADFVAYLSLYLRMQGYASSQIVILTTYSGQVFAIKNVMRTIEDQRRWTGKKTVVDRWGVKSRVAVKPGLAISAFEGLRVTTVDNYQGEESDIVIASFVRSNDDQKIGFLSKDNRVCVALSRAKKGFYCIGNIAMLAKASKTWENISRTLLEGNCVNKGLELYCEVHDYRLLANSPNDFKMFSDEGCPQPCGGRLNCGHTCPKTCHRSDADHAKFLCGRNCERSLPCGHSCPRKCHQKCAPCTERVIKRLGCGHDANAGCCELPEHIFCGTIIEKKLTGCEHTAMLRCSKPVTQYACKEPCQRLMSCGVHRCAKTCSSECGSCVVFVDVKSPCGHIVHMKCCDSENEENVRNACLTDVEVRLACGHTKMLPCRDSGLEQPDKCEQPTEVTCSSGHEFTVECAISTSEKVDEHCETEASVTLECGHQVVRPCHEARNLDLGLLAAECEKIIKLDMPCGHPAPVPCKYKDNVRIQSLLRKECRATIKETLACGHKRVRRCNDDKTCLDMVTVVSSCGHKVVSPCGRKDDVEFMRRQCEARCGKVLQCSHKCSGTCCAGSGDEFHSKCMEKCKKTLFCGHACSSNCHSQCNPCRAREKLSCPHGVKVVECLWSIQGACTKKPKHCAHLSCDAASCAGCYCVCDSGCRRLLPCMIGFSRKRGPRGGNHRCVGLCSELCVCSSCDEEAINSTSLPPGVDRMKARYIKLPCDHVFEVSWLDGYMQRHKNFLSFPKCPKRQCCSQIRLMRRYHKVLERIRSNMQKVYSRVFGDLNAMQDAYREFFKECRTYQDHERREPENPERSQRMREITEFVDKVLKLSRTPTRFVLDYLRLLFELIEDESEASHLVNRRSVLIKSEELQLQLLYDYVVAVNRERANKGLSPWPLPATPVRVDEWIVCARNHVFSLEIHNRCPEC